MMEKQLQRNVKVSLIKNNISVLFDANPSIVFSADEHVHLCFNTAVFNDFDLGKLFFYRMRISTPPELCEFIVKFCQINRDIRNISEIVFPFKNMFVGFETFLSCERKKEFFCFHEMVFTEVFMHLAKIIPVPFFNENILFYRSIDDMLWGGYGGKKTASHVVYFSDLQTMILYSSEFINRYNEIVYKAGKDEFVDIDSIQLSSSELFSTDEYLFFTENKYDMNEKYFIIYKDTEFPFLHHIDFFIAEKQLFKNMMLISKDPRKMIFFNGKVRAEQISSEVLQRVNNELVEFERKTGWEVEKLF